MVGSEEGLERPLERRPLKSMRSQTELSFVGNSKPKKPPETFEEDLDAFLDEYEKAQRDKRPPDELLKDIP